MLDFTCMKCGKPVQGDNQFADDAILCAACNAATSIATAEHAAQAKILTTPSDGAFREGEPPAEPLPSVRRETPRILFRWLVFAVVAGVCLTGGLVLVITINRSREAAVRTQSINNLKRIGLAFHEFHDANKRLPSNGTNHPLGGWNGAAGFVRNERSWAFQILPHMQNAALFNNPDAQTPIPEYMCPGRGRPMVSTTGAWTDYFLNPFINDPDGQVDAWDTRRSLVGITDGTSNTIFLGHGNIDTDLYSRNAAFAQSTDIFKGGDPAMARRSTTNRPDKPGDAALNWGGPFPDGCLFCMGDATVRMFPYSTHSGGAIVRGVAPFWVSGTKSGLGAFLTPTGGAPEGAPHLGDF